MRVILLGGNSSNQKILASKIKNQFDLVGVVIEQKIAKLPSLAQLWEDIRFFQIDNAWVQAMQKLTKDNNEDLGDTPLLMVSSINEKKAFSFIEKLKPDVILVSGTGLIRQPLLDISLSVGMLNWHPGLVPFVRGNPEPTNWCLAENNFHLIGNSIIWLDSGVDTGKLLCSSFVHFKEEKALSEIYYQVWIQGQGLCLNALDYLQKTSRPFQRIEQENLGKGKTYRKKMWNNEYKKALLQNIKDDKFSNKIKESSFLQLREKLSTVALPHL